MRARGNQGNHFLAAAEPDDSQLITPSEPDTSINDQSSQPQPPQPQTSQAEPPSKPEPVSAVPKTAPIDLELGVLESEPVDPDATKLPQAPVVNEDKPAETQDQQSIDKPDLPSEPLEVAGNLSAEPADIHPVVAPESALVEQSKSGKQIPVMFHDEAQPAAETTKKSPLPIKGFAFATTGKALRKKLGIAAAGMAALVLVAGGAVGVMVARNDKTDATGVMGEQTSVTEMAGIQTTEEPVVLEVVDKSKVQQQFLSKAVNGDQVLLYYQAKKAVLYRPSNNQVVSVGEFQPPPPKVFLRQGSPKSKITALEKQLKTFTAYNYVSRDMSAYPIYTETFVIDLNGRYPAEAADLAKSLNVQVGNMPQNETFPEADILIISGPN